MAHHISAGIPQGSILGPLLFLLYINDIASIVESNIRLFADDTSLFFISGKNDFDLQTVTMNGDLSAISIWANQWFISLNETKTKSMLCSRTRVQNKINLFLKNKPVVEVSSHKHLGLTLSNDGSWSNHVDDIYVRAMKRVDCLRGMKYKLDRKYLEKLYFTFIRPILEYANVIWDNCSQACNEKLERVQHAAARVVTGATQSVSLDLLYRELKWESLSDRRKKHKLVLMYKIQNGLAPSYLLDRIPPIHDSGFQTRHAQDFTPIICSSEQRKKSFFPSTVISWPSLDLQTRNSNSISAFKRNLNKNVAHAPAFYFGGNQIAQIQHARMHMFRYNLIDSPKCSCGLENETVYHYLLECPNYAILRNRCFGSLSPQVVNLHTLLFGDLGKDHTWNRNLFNLVEKFILESKRF